jgi:acyl carrier protein
MAPDLLEQLRSLLVSSLRLDLDATSIDPEAELFSGALGLDSLDAVQFIAAVERHFSVQITDAELARAALSTLGNLAALLREKGCDGPRHG